MGQHKEVIFKVVSWKRAFRGAIATVVWNLIWTVIGGLIIFLGFIAGWRTSQYGFPQPQYQIIIPFFLIGIAIIQLGFLAAVYKIASEIAAEEVENRMKRLL